MGARRRARCQNWQRSVSNFKSFQQTLRSSHNSDCDRTASIHQRNPTYYRPAIVCDQHRSSTAVKGAATEGRSPKEFEVMAPKRQRKDTSKSSGDAQTREPLPQGQAIPTQHVQLYNGGQGILLGCRVPKDYFLATGAGDTNEGGGTDPWETGSYDLALEEAHIEDFNVVAYTSVIPPEATEVKYEDVKHTFHHGAVLETIMAKMDGVQGDRISAGVAIMKVRRKRDGFVIGGWAAEYKGHADEKGVKNVLKSDLQGMFDRRFPKGDHEMMDVNFVVRVHEVENSYGTVLASICFCSFIYPIAAPSMQADMAQH